MRRRRSIRASTEFSPPGCTYISRQLCCWHAAKGHHTPPLTVVQPDSLKLWMFNRGTIMSILNTERQPWQNLSRALDKYEMLWWSLVIYECYWSHISRATLLPQSFPGERGLGMPCDVMLLRHSPGLSCLHVYAPLGHCSLAPWQVVLDVSIGAALWRFHV